jgi:hypothetical protein
MQVMLLFSKFRAVNFDIGKKTASVTPAAAQTETFIRSYILMTTDFVSTDNVEAVR